MSSFGRDDLSHLSISLHMELSRTYDTSRTACFIWRHISSIALRSRQPGGRNCSSTPSRRLISSLTNFDLPCVTGVCARRCHVLAMRLVQSSCRLAGRFFKYSGPSRSGTCPVPDGIAGWPAARAGCPLRGSRSCPAGPRREGG